MTPAGSTEQQWTDQDFERMSWHDNPVHAFRIIEGQHGAGELLLDLDYILEWVCDPAGQNRFRLLPVTLAFHEVTQLRVALDYASVTAALGPFSIHKISRRREQRERYVAQVWTIAVNWPAGEISFEARGYTQTATAPSVLSTTQVLPAQQRAGHIPR